MKILFAEDNEIFRKSLSFYLEGQGFTVHQFDNGEEAIEFLRMITVDLIITDLNMPSIGGMEMINIVRNDLNMQIPIIVLTSSGMEETELDAFSMGANEFISKPFSPQVLKARIEKLLRQSTIR